MCCVLFRRVLPLRLFVLFLLSSFRFSLHRRFFTFIFYPLSFIYTLEPAPYPFPIFCACPWSVSDVGHRPQGIGYRV